MKPVKPINKGEKGKIKEKVVLSECDNIYNPKCGANKELLDMEERNRIELGKNPNDDQFLYPNLDDPNFNIKINNKKEFSDTKYDGTIYDVAKHADELSKADYELLPQQAFVKNFMSFQTPYNSLLLFHGLGSGKTCSAIGVCEEMRDYLKQMGISKRIIIVASPNVQDNFKLQLFDERKLKEVDGLWTMKGCLGNKLLKEINPTGMKGLKRDKVVQQVKNIISSSYYFVGYLQFSNDIARHWGKKEEDEEEYDGETEEEKKKADEAFATALAAKKKKLTEEQATVGRIFSIAKSSLEPILKMRPDFMKDKPAAVAPGSPATDPEFGNKPPLPAPGGPRIEAVTPPISVETPPAQ